MTERVSANDPLPNVHRRAPGIVVSLLAVVFLGLVATQWRDRQSVGTINIHGATGLSIKDVHVVADTFAGKTIETVSLADVREKLETLPYVRSAVVHLSGIRSLDIIINERMPVGHVVRADGSLRYVDQTGAILPEAPVRTSHNVPLVRSDDGTVLAAQDLQQVVALLMDASGILDPMLYQTISEIQYDRSSQQLVIVTDRTTWKIDGASDAAAVNAFADMNVFWKNTSTRVDLVHGTQIDLRWRHQVIVRKFNSGT
ncbi:MAG: FtsQ-type POTRA domain-containing protein [bacterium]|nr:FtsQ-type POTRA domain-containing protein [bacterium]